MYRPSESVMAEALEERARVRDSQFQSWMSTARESIRMNLQSRGLPLIDGESQIDGACRLVDHDYPEIFADAAANTQPSVQDNAATIQAAPVDASEYPDMFGQVADRERADMQTGGFMPYELLEGERAFVGYRDPDGSLVKLEVTDIRNASGFDVTPGRRRVVQVAIPGYWLTTEYVQEMIGRLMSAAHSGEPENVIDDLNGFASEQGWDAHELWSQYEAKRNEVPPFTTNSDGEVIDNPAYKWASDAPTETRLERPTSLEEATQINPVIKP